jgi:thiol-disulfide isomerase/thioredoxin
MVVITALAVMACDPADQAKAVSPPLGSRAAVPQAPAEPQAPAGAPGLTAALEGLGFQVPATPVRYVDFSLVDLDGNKRSLESFAGQVVFLNFWATWCPPCRAEMPSMEGLYRELKEEGLAIVAVNSQERREEVADFVMAAGYSFPVLLDESGRVGAVYAVRAIPTTYLVGRDGYILGRLTGSRDWHTAEALAVLRRVLEP